MKQSQFQVRIIWRRRICSLWERRNYYEEIFENVSDGADEYC